MYFPDPEKAIQEVARTVHPDVVLRPPLDRDERAAADGIVEVAMAPSGGTVDDWERTSRVEVTVFAEGRGASYALANDLRAALIGYHATAVGLLDDVFVVTEPHEAPYPNDTVVQVTATYGVVARTQEPPQGA